VYTLPAGFASRFRASRLGGSSKPGVATCGLPFGKRITRLLNLRPLRCSCDALLGRLRTWYVRFRCISRHPFVISKVEQRYVASKQKEKKLLRVWSHSVCVWLPQPGLAPRIKTVLCAHSFRVDTATVYHTFVSCSLHSKFIVSGDSKLLLWYGLYGR
jgi:hypothetical protein